MKSKSFYWLAIIFYVVSLFTPSIVFQPTLADNPKYTPCSLVFDSDGECEALTDDGYACGLVGEGKKKDTKSKKYKEQVAYCGTDWNKPMSESMMGYYILLTGAFGVLMGSFAWFANIFFLIAAVTYSHRNYTYARAFAFGALAVGLQSIFLTEVPRNEGGVDNFVVDHFGPGFYIWMLSFATLLLASAYEYHQCKKSSGNTKEGI